MDILVNWLGQGVVVALLAAAGLRAIPRSRTQARYGFVWAACGVVLVLPAVSWLVATPPDLTASGGSRYSPGPLVAMPIAWWTSIGAAGCAWLVWFGAHAVRVGAAAAALRAARQECRECPDEVQYRLPCWSRIRASGRATRVVISERVHAAGVLGGGAPVIALSPALLEQLDDADLDRVVVHEWAHVQRHDDLAQIVQHFVRMIAGWHPAVWWLNRQLDFEREVACDEIAVRLTGSARGYAGCLTTLAAIPGGSARRVPALAAASSSGLHRRIVRILSARPSLAPQPWRAVAAGAAAPLAALAIAAGHVPFAGSAAASLIASSPDRASSAVTIVPDASSRIRGDVAASRVATPPHARLADSAGRTTPEYVSEPMAAAAQDDVPPPATLPVPRVSWPVGLPAASPAAMPAPAVPLDTVSRSAAAGPMATTPPEADDGPPAPWAPAVDAGISIGRGAQTAGVAAAGFVSRFGRRVAGSF